MQIPCRLEREIIDFPTLFLNEFIGGKVGVKRAEILLLNGKPNTDADDTPSAVNRSADIEDTSEEMDFGVYFEMSGFHGSCSLTLIVQIPCQTGSSLSEGRRLFILSPGPSNVVTGLRT